MHKLKINGQSYKLLFSHFNNDSRKPHKAQSDFPGTRCVIVGEKLEKIGFAKLNPSDQFNKSVGRKVSFSRAISGFNSEIRRDLWRQYEIQFGF